MTNIKALFKRNFKAISDAVHTKYDNVVLEDLAGDYVIRMAVMEEAYRWHYHDHTDEVFIVLEGALQIEIRGQEKVILYPGDFIKIPAKTVHKTSAIGRTVNLCFEKNGEDSIFVD